MFKRFGAIGAVTILALAVFAASLPKPSVVAQDKPQAQMQTWEYRIVLPRDLQDPRANEAQFNSLGAQGWELCVTHSGAPPHYCVFKRAKR